MHASRCLPFRFLLFVLPCVAAPAEIDAPPSPLLQLADATLAAAPLERNGEHGNQLALLEVGHDALVARVHLIRQARRSIALQTFIWTNDECGRLLMFELIEAARRGVRVQILADHMFSDQDADVVAFLASASPNLEIKHYRPAMKRLKPSLWHTLLAGLQSFRDVNQRMHNKVLIVDDAVLITGGRNIENTYFDQSLELNFRDRDVLAVGPVVHAARSSFDHFWNYRHAVPSRELVDVAAALERNTFRRYQTRDEYALGSAWETLDREANDTGHIESRFVQTLHPVESVSFLSDEPGKSHHLLSRSARLTRELKDTVGTAEHTVVVQTPYLVLSDPARRLLRRLQKRRPDLQVRISTNSFASTDNLMAYSANYRLRNLYVEQLRLQVYEFKPQPASLLELLPGHAELVQRAEPRVASGVQQRLPFLCVHAKSLTIDDRVAFVGSYNLDPRSENLNTEVGLLVKDASFARALRERIEADLRPENSWVIARRPLPLRLDAVNGLILDLFALTPVEIWPIQNTTSYELRPGAEPVPPDHPQFHQHYREAGAFPGTDGRFSTKEIVTRLYKAVGAPLTPIL